jgi:hypothetical protein
VFERLYRGEKRLIPLSLERSSIRNRTPSLESEVALTRDSERIHKQSVLETLPSLTVEAGRAEQPLLKQISLVAEDSSNDKLLTPTALHCVNCSFDGKGERGCIQLIKCRYFGDIGFARRGCMLLRPLFRHGFV